MRRIHLDQHRNLLAIEFRYDKGLVSAVRELPQRRWDPMAKVWLIPVQHLQEVCQALVPMGFELGEGVQHLLQNGAGANPNQQQKAPDDAGAAHPNGPSQRLVSGVNERAPRQAKPLPQAPTTPPADETYTVSSLNYAISRALRLAIPGEVWITGELVGYSRRAGSRHAFFELVEKGTGDAIRARIGAVIWGDDRRLIQRRLRMASEPFELEDGLVVRLRVAVDFYEAGGRLQLVVRDIDPVFTLGELARAREAILKELGRRDLLQRNSALPMPAVPLRVALLTSPSGEAPRDFLDELTSSGLGFQVDLFPVMVQGPSLESSVTKALGQISAATKRTPDEKPYDVVVIIRGGGSRTDLGWFDNLNVALAVATCPIKVLIGIGHQRDQSVLDLIAASAKTPTAAGVQLVQEVWAYLDAQVDAAQRLNRHAKAHVSDARNALRALNQRVGSSFDAALKESKKAIADAATLLGPRALRLADKERALLRQHSAGLIRQAQAELRVARHDIAGAQRVLTSTATMQPVRGAKRQLDDAERQLHTAQGARLTHWSLLVDRLELTLRANDPAHFLRRGFARLRSADGAILTKIANLTPGDAIRIELDDGHATAHVDSVSLTETVTETVTSPPQDNPNKAT